jgi:hypothetical protein
MLGADVTQFMSRRRNRQRSRAPPLRTGPDSPQARANCATVVGARYKGRGSFCEIWNDPDSKQLLDPVDPAAYTALVKAAYPAIKITDQSPIVVRGVVVAVVSGAQLAMNPARMYVAP